MWHALRRLFRRADRSAHGGRADAPAVARRSDWQRVPPLRSRLHDRVPEVSGVIAFANNLTERNTAPRYVAPLGHDVLPSAPGGTATGIARAVLPSASDRVHGLPLRRRQGRRADLGSLTWPTSPDGGPTPPPGPDDAEPATPRPADAAPPAAGRDLAGSPATPTGTSTDEPTARMVGPTASAPPSAARLPLRVLRASAPAPSTIAPTTRPPRPRGLPLRSLRVDRAPDTEAPATGQVPAPSPSVTGDATPPAAAQATAPLVSEQATIADPSAVPRSDDVAPTERAASDAVTSSGPLAPIHRSSLPPHRSKPPRRTGLGAPLKALPATARGVHDEAPRPPGPAVTATGREEAISRGLQRLVRPPAADAEPREEPRQASRPADDGDATTPSVDLSVPPVVARRLEPAVATTLTHTARRRPPDRPLAGQRAPLLDPPAPPTTPPTEATEAPIPIRWSTPSPPVPAAPGPTRAGGALPQILRAATTATRTGPAVTKTSPAPSPSGPSRPSEAARSSSEPHTPATHAAEPAAPRRMPAELQSHPLVQRLRRSPSAATAPALNGSAPPATPHTRLPLATPVHRHVEPEAPGVTAVAPVSRNFLSAPATDVVQRTVEVGDATVQAISPDADAGAQVGPDVDELFDELYPRVRDELRWELRVQRERAGLLCDPM